MVSILLGIDFCEHLTRLRRIWSNPTTNLALAILVGLNLLAHLTGDLACSGYGPRARVPSQP